jgi:hypothetical protein
VKLKLKIDQRNISIFSDSQAALKAFQAAKTASLSVRRCQKALNDISDRHTVWLYWGTGLADKLSRYGSDQRFVGPELFLGPLGRT